MFCLIFVFLSFLFVCNVCLYFSSFDWDLLSLALVCFLTWIFLLYLSACFSSLFVCMSFSSSLAVWMCLVSLWVCISSLFVCMSFSSVFFDYLYILFLCLCLSVFYVCLYIFSFCFDCFSVYWWELLTPRNQMQISNKNKTNSI